MNTGYGGELLSLAIPYDNATSFADAGYAPVIVNDTYIGGQVRQYGNLSFTRVYEAGHEVPAYQPETAYRIFTRHSSTATSAPEMFPQPKILTTQPKGQATCTT